MYQIIWYVEICSWQTVMCGWISVRALVLSRFEIHKRYSHIKTDKLLRQCWHYFVFSALLTWNALLNPKNDICVLFKLNVLMLCLFSHIVHWCERQMNFDSWSDHVSILPYSNSNKANTICSWLHIEKGHTCLYLQSMLLPWENIAKSFNNKPGGILLATWSKPRWPMHRHKQDLECSQVRERNLSCSKLLAVQAELWVYGDESTGTATWQQTCRTPFKSPLRWAPPIRAQFTYCKSNIQLFWLW